GPVAHTASTLPELVTTVSGLSTSDFGGGCCHGSFPSAHRRRAQEPIAQLLCHAPVVARDRPPPIGSVAQKVRAHRRARRLWAEADAGNGRPTTHFAAPKRCSAMVVCGLPRRVTSS